MTIIGEPVAPNLINPDVVKQGLYWWDVFGRRHTIAEMDYDYALNIIEFCYGHSLLSEKFPYSTLSDALRARLFDAFEKAKRYEGLCR